MPKSKDVRPVITLACSECKERNYTTQKNRRNDPNRLEFKKFCPRCRCHRLHRETKKRRKTNDKGRRQFFVVRLSSFVDV